MNLETLSWWQSLILFLIGPVFLAYMIYSIGRYNERQRIKKAFIQWVETQPDDVKTLIQNRVAPRCANSTVW